jgi:hypothetical protein
MKNSRLRLSIKGCNMHVAAVFRLANNRNKLREREQKCILSYPYFIKGARSKKKLNGLPSILFKLHSFDFRSFILQLCFGSHIFWRNIDHVKDLVDCSPSAHRHCISNFVSLKVAQLTSLFQTSEHWC